MNTLGRGKTSWEKAAPNQKLKFCHKEHLPERRILVRCVVDRWNGISVTRYWSYFPLFSAATTFPSDGCYNWFNRLLKIFLGKKIVCLFRFCYFCYMLTVVTLVITEKASDKYTMEANYSVLFISMYKNGKIILIHRQ